MEYLTAEIDFTAWANGGAALGKLPDGRVVFAKGAIPGERAEVRYPNKESRFFSAEVTRLIQESDCRIPPRCPLFGACTGCQFQFLSYTDQLRAKRDVLVDHLRRLGKVSEAESRTDPVRPAPAEWNYRRQTLLYPDERGRLCVMDGGGNGLPLEGYCPLCADVINENLSGLELEADHGLDAVEIRAADNDELQVIFHGEADTPQNEIENDSQISLVYEGGGNSFVMSGVSTIRQTVGSETLAVSDSSPFPANPEALENAGAALCKLLPTAPFDAIQIHCGVGFFSRLLSQKALNLTVLALDEQESEDFLFNLDDAENVSLYLGPIGQNLANLPLGTNETLFIEAGPSGEHPDLFVHLCGRAPRRVIYYGTDPAILGRDCARLTAGGYRLDRVIPFDPAPQTAEIHALALFVK